MPTADEWNPDNEAVWQEKIPADEPGKSRAITLRHPTYPFLGRWTTQNPDDLTNIAAGYLRKIAGHFGLPANLLATDGSAFTATPPSGLPLAWLPIGVDDLPGPRVSFWIRRYRGLPAQPILIDRTAVLLAIQSAAANDATKALGSRLGIRIVAHVSTDGEAPATVRITGATCSADLARPARSHGQELSAFFDDFFSDTFRTTLKARVREVAQLDSDARLWIDGVRIRGERAGSPSIEVYLNLERPPDLPFGLAYALTVQISLRGRDFVVDAVEKSPLTAHASPVSARLFQQDPASEAGRGHLVEVRPNRRPQAFEPFRHSTVLPGLTLVSGQTHLLDDLGQVKVTQSKLVDKLADESKEEVVVQPTNVPHARTNPFAALSGYQHARELFDTMRSYGVSPTTYFRLADWPLLVRYRATINPGPGKDGKTVNAQVDYDPPGYDAGTPWKPNALKPLQVRFALADMIRSASRREPLGLTADPRWSWHEYCHVLIAASTGALEFPFAHSAGDALAAIRWDPPPSKLAGPSLRMATFPWVYLNRRHDRSVYYGWSWCGSYHRPARFAPAGSRPRRKGYQSEQILSTSLFRLYRALGGDTVLSTGNPDPTARRAAADYTAYLIIQAIAWLGPVSGVPAETPDQLVSALTDADIGISSVAQGPLKGRVGGWAHKVVRWAFEAQGLYATTDPQAIVDAPGQPPAIDVFIDNGRPDSDGAFKRGGYMPVSLDWFASPNPSPWHASPGALQVVSNQVSVKVRNRGQLPANGVVVQVSYAPWPTTQPDPPPWNTAAWTSFPPSAPQTVPKVGEVQFGPFPGLPTLPKGDRLLILAQATCPGDRANTDPATTFPCSTQPTPIVDLVAGDNNLGLRLYFIP
jgi:hypothetical protein